MRERYSLRKSICRWVIIVWTPWAAVAEPGRFSLTQDYHIAASWRTASAALDATQRRVDLGAGELPIVVEIGHDLLHERLGLPDRPGVVAKVVRQNRQRELPWAVALVGPFEAEFGEALDLVMLAKRMPVHGHHEAVDGAFAFVSLHGNSPTRHRHGRELRDIRARVDLPDGIDQRRNVMAGIPARGRVAQFLLEIAIAHRIGIAAACRLLR